MKEIKIIVIMIGFIVGCETINKENIIVEDFINCIKNDKSNKDISCYSNLISEELYKKFDTEEFIKAKEELIIILKNEYIIKSYSEELKNNEDLFEINCKDFQVYVLIFEKQKYNIYFQVKNNKVSSFYPIRKGSTIIGWL